MARPRVRRKTKNPSSKVSRKQKNPYKVSFAGAHPLIKENWDKSLTLQENYKRLGLITRLNGSAGGQGHSANAAYSKLRDQLAEKIEAEVEWRDMDESPSTSVKESNVDSINSLQNEDWGVEAPKFLDERVMAIGSKVNLKKIRHLRIDQVMDAETDDQTEETTQIKDVIIGAMEKESKEQCKIIRSTSEQEDMVLETLERKYGSDLERMARDMKLNKYQFTAGQLKKKFERRALKEAGVKRVLLNQ